MLNLKNLPESEFIKKDKDGKYTIFSGGVEFGYELLAVIPLSYLLAKNGMLRATISGFDTGSLYYFSPCHTEVEVKRDFKNVANMMSARFPNINIHAPIDFSLLSFPPYKEHFLPERITFKKPTCVISNRYASEWDRKPVNYLNKNWISKIISLLKKRYQVVLIQSSDFSSEYEDHSKFEKFGLTDDECHSLGILNLNILRTLYPGESINSLQCKIYAGCGRFISSNGGLGILASYFGGENIIFSKKCHELDPDINSFHSFYYRISNCDISVVSDECSLYEIIKSKYIDEDIQFNILVRTSMRPHYFHDCMKSILEQNYKNFRILVSVDNEETREYVKKWPCLIVETQAAKEKPESPEGPEYGVYFPYNLYFNELLKYVRHGYVIYMDDDNAFAMNNALSILHNSILKHKADLVFWKIAFPGRVVPSDASWRKKKPILLDLDSGCFTFSAKYRPVWTEWKRGDYRVGQWLYDHIPNKYWLNKVLLRSQRKKEGGFGKRDDKERIITNFNPPLVLLMSVGENDSFFPQCFESLRSAMTECENMDVSCLIALMDNSAIAQINSSGFDALDSRIKFFSAKHEKNRAILENSLTKKIFRQDTLLYFIRPDTVFSPLSLVALYKQYINLRSDPSKKLLTSLTSLPLPVELYKSISRKTLSSKNECNSVTLKETESPIGCSLLSLIRHISRFGLKRELSASYLDLLRLWFASNYKVPNIETVLDKSLNISNLLIDRSFFEELNGFIPCSFYARTEMWKRAKALGHNCIQHLKIPPIFNLVDHYSITRGQFPHPDFYLSLKNECLYRIYMGKYVTKMSTVDLRIAV